MPMLQAGSDSYGDVSTLVEQQSAPAALRRLSIGVPVTAYASWRLYSNTIDYRPAQDSRVTLFNLRRPFEPS